MTTSAALALLAALLLGTSDFLGGTLARRLPLLTILVLSQAVGTMVTLTWLAVPEPPAPWAPAIGWGIVGGLGVAVGISSLYRALALGTMGVVAPIAALSVVIPVIGGLATGDRLGPVLGLGLVLAVTGTVLASGPEFRTGSAGRRPVLLALVAALGFGVSNCAIAWGSAFHVSGTLVANAVTALAVYIGVAAFRRVRPRARGRDLAGIAAIGVLGFGANLAFALATRSGPLSVAAVFASLFPAVTALLAWVGLRERLGRLQLCGVGLILVGVGLVAGAS